MARTASETARILSNLYEENFGRNQFDGTVEGTADEPFQIAWPQLRSLAAVRRLDDAYLKDISAELSESARCLVAFDNYLIVLGNDYLQYLRSLPDRLLEQYLPDENEKPEIDETDDEDI
jgi:hypothetical protein